MKEQDKREIRQIFNEGLEQLVLPILDDIYNKMATKEDLKNMTTKKDLKDLKEDVKVIGNDVDSIKRTLNAEISWRDDASKRLKKVEVKLGFAK